MNELTPQGVKGFLTAKYQEPIKALGLDPASLGDDFDFLLSGVVDSFGILEMVSSIEQQFGIELDLANLDAEKMTILGPLSSYVAETAK
ncbi:MAG: acyl carrier protein [Verrucomicrobia bacterium]|nr:acyl carrier protein [Verrucomicrobiota bacterium]